MAFLDLLNSDYHNDSRFQELREQRKMRDKMRLMRGKHDKRMKEKEANLAFARVG